MYVSVVSYPTPGPSVFVNLVGTVEGKNIIIEHRGGDALSLNTKFQIDIGKNTTTLIIGEKNYLDDDAKKDSKWNVGERLVFPFDYNLSNCEAKIKAIDIISNKLIMMGSLDITPESDVGLNVTVSNRFPKILDFVTFTITVTNYQGDLDKTGVIVQYILPKGLIHKSNHSTQGTYDMISGKWMVGELEVRESAKLKITAEVVGEPTQLAILLDGSASIPPDSWWIMKNGLANAINNSKIFPHSGAIELTIIQFGVNYSCSDLEVGPKVVNKNNYQQISNEILAIEQGLGVTPMAAGIYLAADTLPKSKNFGGFDTDNRQIINIVTDGIPNVISGPGELCGDFEENYKTTGGKLSKFSAQEAREYLISKLSMTEDQDEIDVVAVDTREGISPDFEWLRDKIVWPQPGYTSWPPEGPGWVHKVFSWQEFADSIDEQFKLLFGSITSNMKITYTSLRDPNIVNNQVSITITTK
jgi:uncharacterized repeat protein (TIGR01451 family)